MKEFEDIYLENKLDEIEQEYIKGLIDSKEAEHLLRSIWGQLGYKVSSDNAQEYIKLLHESKQHLILKQPNLTTEQKEKAIAFFNKYKNLEKEIDWNKKDIPYEEFERVYQLANNTKSAKKREVSSGNLAKQFFGTCVEVWYYDENVIFASPTCHEDAIFMDSFECFGSGAKWCIGTKDDGKHWETYTQEYMSAFLFVYNAKSKQKFMIEILNMDDSHPLSLWNAEDDDIVVKGEVDDVIYKMGILIDYEDLIKDLIPKVVDLFVPLRSKFHSAEIDTPEKVFDILEKMKEIPNETTYEQIKDKLGYMFQDGNKADEILEQYIKTNIQNIDEKDKLVSAVGLFKEHHDMYGDNTPKMCVDIIIKILNDNAKFMRIQDTVLEIVKRRPDLAVAFILSKQFKNSNERPTFGLLELFTNLAILDKPEVIDDKYFRYGLEEYEYDPPEICETVYNDKKIHISKTSLSNLNNINIDNRYLKNNLLYPIRAIKNDYHPDVRKYKTPNEFNEITSAAILWIIYIQSIRSFLLVVKEKDRRELYGYVDTGLCSRGDISYIIGNLNNEYINKAELGGTKLRDLGYNIPYPFKYLDQNREFKKVFGVLQESILSFEQIHTFSKE